MFLFLLQLLNRENKEPIVLKDDSVEKPVAVQPSPIQNQLPQSQTDATSVPTATPAKPQTGNMGNNIIQNYQEFTGCMLIINSGWPKPNFRPSLTSLTLSSTSVKEEKEEDGNIQPCPQEEE